MTQKKYESFLKKINVELPEPRSMEGFGMELPSVYLDRCLDVIVPATEAYLEKLKESVMDDFMAYVKEYKGLKNTQILLQPKKEVVKTPVVIKAPTTVKKEIPANELTGEALLERIQTFIDEHPEMALVDVAKKLGMNSSKLFRNLKKLRDRGVKFTGDRRSSRPVDLTPEQAGEFLKKNPTASSHDVAVAFGVSISSAYRRIVEYKKKYGDIPTQEVVKKVEVVKKTESIKKDDSLSVENKENSTVINASKNPYNQTGYMADIRSRYENRNNKVEEAKKVDKPVAIEPKKEENKAFVKRPSTSLHNFLQLKYFSSLTEEEKEKATVENWMTAPADVLLVENLAKKFLEVGLQLRSRELTKLEYNMLKGVLTNNSMSNVDKRRTYSDYLSVV